METQTIERAQARRAAGQATDSSPTPERPRL